MNVLKGIDVSVHQGKINWDLVAPNIDFAIIRCGYGSDLTHQDDKQFENNVKACQRLGIPFGVYLYSYANTDEKLQSEIQHALRMLKKTECHPFCVYFDMEDAVTTKLGKTKLTEYGLTFCKAMSAYGFKAGIYANQYWCNTYLDIAKIHSAGYSIWCAKYSTSKPVIDAPYDIWQFSSKERLAGIAGYVDMNYMYNDIRHKPAVTEPIKLSTDALADAIIEGKFGNDNERVENLKTLGYTAAEITAAQAEVNRRYAKPVKLSTSKLADAIIAGKYGNGNERIEKLKAEGYSQSEINAAQAEVNARCSNVKNAQPKKLSTNALALAIIRGEFGNGSTRITALKEAGYTDAEIKAAQKVVNNKM